MKYFINFTQLSSRIYWGKAALLWQAYNSLAKRIKNEMVHHKKPMTLSGLRKLMQAIYACYKERKAEITCETPAANSSSNKSEKNDNNKSSSDKGKISLQSKQNNNNNSSSSSLQNKGNAQYKKVTNHIWPVRTTLPDEYCIICRVPSDPLLSLPILPIHPPDFIPLAKFTSDRREKMAINASGFLGKEEENLILFLIKAQEDSIAWDTSKQGSFRADYFNPIVIPTIQHVPWVERNIPIPPGIYNKVVCILKEKISVGVYERSNSSYWSKLFCILKKDRKSL